MDRQLIKFVPAKPPKCSGCLFTFTCCCGEETWIFIGNSYNSGIRVVMYICSDSVEDGSFYMK